jgi:putative FmdB family regulatory protein
MPLYEYECREHGTFELHRSVADFDLAGPCATCQRDSPRVLSVPGLRFTTSSERIARDRNERSRNEPRIVVRQGAPSSEARLRVAAGRQPWAIGHG